MKFTLLPLLFAATATAAAAVSVTFTDFQVYFNRRDEEVVANRYHLDRVIFDVRFNDAGPVYRCQARGNDTYGTLAETTIEVSSFSHLVGEVTT